MGLTVDFVSSSAQVTCLNEIFAS